MTYCKTPMSQFGRGFSKLASSTLATGFFACGLSLLSAGAAQAVGTVNCSPATSGPFTMSVVNVTAGNNPDKTPPCQINSAGNLGTVVNQWEAGQIDTSGTYRYSLTAAGRKFTEFSLNADISFNQMGTATKSVYSDAGYTNLIGMYTSVNGASVAFTPLSDQTLSTVYVQDSYMFNGTTQLNSISNNFKVTAPASTVPGPLPILGAGASFAFSRKLRRRIKSAF
jgi:hypothetical protein